MPKNLNSWTELYNLQAGNYIRWVYPLGNLQEQKKESAYGLLLDLKNDDDWLEVSAHVMHVKTGMSFWLSLELLIEIGNLEVLHDGKWSKVPSIWKL